MGIDFLKRRGGLAEAGGAAAREDDPIGRSNGGVHVPLSFHTMYKLNGFRKSTPPQNLQPIV